MLVHRAVYKIILISLVFCVASISHAQKKTVGDLLKKIERDAERVQLKKRSSNLPSIKRAEKREVRRVNLRAIKPPQTSKIFYQSGSDEAALMKQTDEAIAQLYKLTQRYKKSSQRGELWLRLAEQYVEKAKLIEYKLQTQYDEDMKRYLEKKTKRRPRLDLSTAQSYNKKAIQLYEWFIRDFPKDEKVPQALYFLGFNNFAIGNLKKGEQYYTELTKRFPRSPYVTESNYALAEFYFDNEKWKNSLSYYLKVVRDKRHRLNPLATYKAGWCYYKLNNTKRGIKFLEKVIVDGRRSKSDGATQGNRIRLAKEAIKDLVLFYAEVGNPNLAYGYFADIIGPKSAGSYVGKLGDYYLDTGNTKGAKVIFTKLIQEEPLAPESFDYKTKIVNLLQTSKDQTGFQQELYEWISTYGPKGRWQQANAKNEKLVAEANKKMEFTLRNYILQQHQTAQNARTESAQKRATLGYRLYFDTFENTEKYAEMRFFYGELLFDMGEFEKAAVQYSWVIEKAPKSEYAEKAILNTLLALEKQLPTAEEIKKIVGDDTEPVQFTRNIVLFEKAALRFFETNPNGENIPAIKYRVGALHYYFNHFDDALKYFNEIVEKYPKTEFASYSANLILDIYNLKKDYKGLQAAAQNILSVPALANSDVGKQVEDIKVQADFKLAKDMEATKDYAKAAETYKAFAQSNKSNPLAVTAVYNAGINYERAGQIDEAIPMYEAVAASKAAKDKSLVFNSAKFLPPLYEKLGQYQKAAVAYEAFAKDHPKDKLSVEYRYNAGIIFDALNQYSNSIRNLNVYYDNKNGSEKFEALFLLGNIYERLGRLDRALGYYDQYMNSGTVNAAGVVEAAYSISKIHEKRKATKYQEEWLEKTVLTQKALARKGKVVGVSYAAEAKFLLVDDTYYELIRVKIPASSKAQAAAVQKKLGLLNKLKEQLKDVIAYDDGFQIVAALNLQGKALYHMYASLMEAPKPKGLNAEEVKQYEAGIANIANPFKDQAKETLELAVKRGYELRAYNDSLQEAVELLAKINGNDKEDLELRVKTVSAADWMGVKWDTNSETRILQITAEKLGKDPKDIKVLNALALYYLDSGKPRLAKIILNRALESAPKEAGLYNNLGVIYDKEGDRRAAMENFAKSLDFGRYNLGTLNLSSIYLKHKDYKPALSPLKNAYRGARSELDKDDSAVAIANNYALALIGTGSPKSAEDVFEAILKSGNRDAEVNLNYATLLIKVLNKKIDGQRILSKIQFMTEDSAILKRALELENDAS